MVYRFQILRTCMLCALTLTVLAACEQSPEFQEGAPSNTGTNSETGESTTNLEGNGTASARLSWDIPSFRENGEPLSLSEIAGYEIAYRQISENTFSTIVVEDSNTSSHEITNLPAGNYEFMIAVFDTEGLFSEYSNPVTASVGGS